MCQVYNNIIKSRLAKWITGDILKVIDDIIIDAGYSPKQQNDLTTQLNKYAPVILLEMNVSFQLLSSDNQELVILKLKQIAENRRYDVALAEFLERLGDHLAAHKLETFGKLFAKDFDSLRKSAHEILQIDQNVSIIRELVKGSPKKSCIRAFE